MNILVLVATLKSSMSYTEAKTYLEKNRIYFDEILAIDEKTGVPKEYKFGLTCEGDWRVGIGTRGTHVFQKGDTLSLFSMIDSSDVNNKAAVIRIMEIIDKQELRAIRKDQYGISFGFKSYGFDGRSDIEYCLASECYGRLILDNYFFSNGKPVW